MLDNETGRNIIGIRIYTAVSRRTRDLTEIQEFPPEIRIAIPLNGDLVEDINPDSYTDGIQYRWQTRDGTTLPLAKARFIEGKRTRGGIILQFSFKLEQYPEKSIYRRKRYIQERSPPRIMGCPNNL